VPTPATTKKGTTLKGIITDLTNAELADELRRIVRSPESRRRDHRERLMLEAAERLDPIEATAVTVRWGP
jgi:hypothetical protein